MNPINRIGQKVVCIAPAPAWLFICPTIKDKPKQGETYTVTGFETYANIPGIHLRELASLSCQCAEIEGAPWPITAFRPLDQRKTDIGELTKILDHAPETVDA